MLKRTLVALATLAAFGACTTPAGPTDGDRALAAVNFRVCDDFNRLSGREKLDAIYGKHMDSIHESMASAVFPMLPPEFKNLARKLPVRVMMPTGTSMPKSHLERFAKFISQVTPDSELLAATVSFLLPGERDHVGWPRLNHTLVDRCDFLERPNPKLVHGLASFAKAHLQFYPRLIKIRPSPPSPSGETYWEAVKVGNTIQTVENPWSGLFDPRANPKGVPLLIRFSLANPVLKDLEVRHGPFAGTRLNLEFIPGLGIKFMVDKKKNMDLVAMESLAGQEGNHGYFVKEFSPDFSRHAPPGYLANGPERGIMERRYIKNPANQWVMNQVGLRFEQSMVATYAQNHPEFATIFPFDPAQKRNVMSAEQKTGRYGPHPFMIGIQGMAAVDTAGTEIDPTHQKRPFRIIFEPATGEIPRARREKIQDSTPHDPLNQETDFRTKLAYLRRGDPVYYMTAETERGDRYRIGKIVLDSPVLPSRFQDREYFVHHEIETARLHDRKLCERGEPNASLYYISDPERTGPPCGP